MVNIKTRYAEIVRAKKAEFERASAEAAAHARAQGFYYG